MAGEGELVLSASGANSVTILATKLDHNFDKPLLDIQMTNFKDDMANEIDPTTWLIDLGKVKELVQIQGFLEDEPTEAAQKKKDNLEKLIKFHREVTITWGTGNRQQVVVGNINKSMITETAGAVGNAQESGYESEKIFAIQLSLIVGTDK